MATANRARGRPFPKGTSGNPSGRPAGSKHRSTVLAEKLMQADATAIVGMVLTLAKAGDLTACRIVIDRLIPPVKERPLSIALPATDTADGIAQAQGDVLQAVALGDLLPSEGAALSALLEARRKAIETNDLMRRLDALEGKATP
jgi:hypothetical protein